MMPTAPQGSCGKFAIHIAESLLSCSPVLHVHRHAALSPPCAGSPDASTPPWLPADHVTESHPFELSHHPLPQERLQLEAPPTVALEPNMEASLKELLDSIAGRVQSIGDNIKGAWDAAGAAVGNGIMRVGYAISQLL